MICFGDRVGWGVRHSIIVFSNDKTLPLTTVENTERTLII